MQQIAFYILIASLTITSPGPGVLLTNTLNYNLRNAMAGNIGVVAGMGELSIVATSSVGVIITTSQLALLVLKVAGAAGFPAESQVHRLLYGTVPAVH